MTRIMRDSNRPTAIPVHGTELVAGYVNGRFKWHSDGFARFRGIPHVHIDIFGSDPEEAGVLDVEPGCAALRGPVMGQATEGTVPGWISTSHLL